MANVVRNVALGLAGAAGSFLLGVAYAMTSVMGMTPSDTPDLGARITSKAVARTDRTLQDEVPALRADITEIKRCVAGLVARANPSSTSANAPALPVGSRELYHVPAGTAAGVAGSFVRDASYTGEPPNLAHLTELDGWRTDPQVRRKWLFTAERDVAAYFGAPDEIVPDTASEWWLYWKDGKPSTLEKYSLRVSAGRLVDASFVVQKPTAERR
jgi:hypothetical protein